MLIFIQYGISASRKTSFDKAIRMEVQHDSCNKDTCRMIYGMLRNWDQYLSVAVLCIYSMLQVLISLTTTLDFGDTNNSHVVRVPLRLTLMSVFEVVARTIFVYITGWSFAQLPWFNSCSNTPGYKIVIRATYCTEEKF